MEDSKKILVWQGRVKTEAKTGVKISKNTLFAY